MATAAAAASTADKRQAFLGVYKQLKDEVLADPMLSQRDASAWMSRMLDYNAPGGKLNRGLSVKDTLLAIKADASAEDQHKADTIGWAIELLQVRPCAHLRGPCWL